MVGNNFGRNRGVVRRCHLFLEVRDFALLPILKQEPCQVLRKRNSSQVDNHRLIYRPWGTFKTLEEGKNFYVKRLSINPMQKISLQKHSYRSEHWVVVKGSALITKDDEKLATKRVYLNEITVKKYKKKAYEELM